MKTRPVLCLLFWFAACCSVTGCATHQAAQPAANPPAATAEPATPESYETQPAPRALPVTAPSVSTGALRARDGQVPAAWFKVAAIPGKTFTFALKADGDLVLTFKDHTGASMFYTMDGDQVPDFPADNGIMVGVESKSGTVAGPYELTIGLRD